MSDARATSISGPSPALAPPPGNPRFPLMDSVRGIAILLVLVNHTAGLSGGWSAPVWGRPALYADVGVFLFFVLSGFLLYRPFVMGHAGRRPAPQLRDYLRRRVLRIVPGFWLALTLLAIWPGIKGPFDHDWWRYYFFLQVYSPRTVTLGVASAWSLCVEVTFYLLLPVFAAGVARLIARRHRGAWWQIESISLGVFAAVGLVVIAVASHFQLSPPWSYTLPATTEMFAAGMALAVASVAVQGREQESRLVRTLVAHPGLSWGLALGLFAVGIYVFDIRVHPASTLKYVGNRVTLTLAAALVVLPAVFGGRALVHRILAARPLAWIGLISYGIFLWHFSVAAWLYGRREPGDDGPGLSFIHNLHHFRMLVFFTLTLVVSAAFASASYYGVELWFLKLKERRLPVSLRRPQEAPGA